MNHSSSALAVAAAVGLFSILAVSYAIGWRQRSRNSSAKAEETNSAEMLPNVHATTIREQKAFNGRVFPLVLTPAAGAYTSLAELQQMIRHSKDTIDHLLLCYKAILFRGFPVEGPEGFNALAEAFDYGVLEYVGGAAVRTQLAARVFTANEAPSSEKIPFHHEMAQVPRYPTHLLFYGDTPAESGGETPILPSSEVCRRLEEIHPAKLAMIEELGVQYIRVMPEEDDATSAIGRSWKSTFLTQDKLQAESKLDQLGSSWAQRCGPSAPKIRRRARRG